MSQRTWPNGSYADFADLAGRREALRQAAAMPGADRTGTARQADCRLLTSAGPAEATMTVSVITPPDGTRLLAVTISEPRAARTEPDASGEPGASAEGTARSGKAGDAIQVMTRRMDMVTAVTRLLARQQHVQRGGHAPAVRAAAGR